MNGPMNSSEELLYTYVAATGGPGVLNLLGDLDDSCSVCPECGWSRFDHADECRMLRSIDVMRACLVAKTMNDNKFVTSAEVMVTSRETGKKVDQAFVDKLVAINAQTSMHRIRNLFFDAQNEVFGIFLDNGMTIIIQGEIGLAMPFGPARKKNEVENPLDLPVGQAPPS